MKTLNTIILTLQYDRFGLVDIATGIAAIRAQTEARNKNRVPLSGAMLKLASLRLRTFAGKGTQCSACGLQASHFAIERSYIHAGLPEEEQRYHLNLWGVKDSEEILFTHDHTLARCLGGANTVSNSTTMCTICNGAKSVGERHKLELRRQVDAAKKLVSKKGIQTTNG